MKMNEEPKKLWIEALRSNKYKQAKGKLKRDDSYCCLGVLCDLYSKVDSLTYWDEEDRFVISERDDNDDSLLPHAVMVWANLDDPSPRIKEGAKTLAAMNDNGASFLDIAELIEKHL